MGVLTASWAGSMLEAGRVSSLLWSLMGHLATG